MPGGPGNVLGSIANHGEQILVWWGDRLASDDYTKSVPTYYRESGEQLGWASGGTACGTASVPAGLGALSAGDVKVSRSAFYCHHSWTF